MGLEQARWRDIWGESDGYKSIIFQPARGA